MTTKLYKKAFAGVALAASVLLTGLVPKAEANPYAAINDASNNDLLARNMRTSVTSQLVPEASDIVSDIVRSSVTSNINPIRGFSSRSSMDISMSLAAQDAYESIERSFTPHRPSNRPMSLAAQDAYNSSTTAQDIDKDSRIAQGVIPVEDTFAPLTDDEIRRLLLINPSAALDRPQPVPGSGFLTPSAYGADWGDAFIGLAGVTAGRTDNKWDGSASVGVGFGDAVDNVGVELSLGIISLDGFAEDGTVGFKLHKVFPRANNLAVAAGWSNAISWGAAENAEDTFYGVVTQRFDLQPGRENTLPLTASLGVGTGSFRSLGAIAADSNDPNVFGSLGLRVIPELSIVSGWTGSALGLGVSAAPFDFPLVVTAGVSDVTDNTRTGPRFNASLGYSFSF
ncbi:MAG: hypothetical protein AAF810_26110 [Cyanobacteria bacterium P01_D01_bin.36]